MIRRDTRDEDRTEKHSWTHRLVGREFFFCFFYDVCVFKKSSRVVLVLGTVIYRGRGKNKEGKNTEGSKIKTTENKEARHLTEIQKTQVNAGRL